MPSGLSDQQIASIMHCRLQGHQLKQSGNAPPPDIWCDTCNVWLMRREYPANDCDFVISFFFTKPFEGLPE